MQKNWDAIIVGGGAAGLWAAGTAASRGRSVLVLEKNNKAGVKILMSGGTRCNITHNCDSRKIAEAYGKLLESNGWKTDGSGVKSDDYLLAEYKKEKAEVTLRATLRGGEIQATLSGDGLLWTKALPVAKQVIAYETWLRIHQHPASLDLLDMYIAEMKAIGKK